MSFCLHFHVCMLFLALGIARQRGIFTFFLKSLIFYRIERTGWMHIVRYSLAVRSSATFWQGHLTAVKKKATISGQKNRSLPICYRLCEEVCTWMAQVVMCSPHNCSRWFKSFSSCRDYTALTLALSSLARCCCVCVFMFLAKNDLCVLHEHFLF